MPDNGLPTKECLLHGAWVHLNNAVDSSGYTSRSPLDQPGVECCLYTDEESSKIPRGQEVISDRSKVHLLFVFTPASERLAKKRTLCLLLHLLRLCWRQNKRRAIYGLIATVAKCYAGIC